MMISDFFFLRPFWLWLLVPAIFLVAYAWRRRGGGDGDWQKLVDPHLLRYLAVQGRGNTVSRWLPSAFAAGLIAAIIALAGPTWQKIELPSYKSSRPIVIAMSLAQSMNATDISPSRITRAGHKVRDLLDRSKGGDAGFIVYADRPFVAAPLTSDERVILEMLPELSTDLMPVLGNRPDLAIDKAVDLLRQAGAKTGRIVVIADSAGESSAKAIAAAKKASSAGYSVSVLGVGTKKGSQLQTASGDAIKTRDGKLITTRLDEAALKQVAKAGNGNYARLTADGRDVRALVPKTASGEISIPGEKSELTADGWNDVGYWLLLIPLVLAPLAFRRGVLLALPVLIAIGSLGQASNAEASQWSDLWKTPDQQAEVLFKKGNFAAAATDFKNPGWKASALYKAGKYKQAANLYDNVKTETNNFNKGNALARSGALKEALDAYQLALKQNPGDVDAKFNRDLVSKLLKEQKKKKDQKKKQKQKAGGKKKQDKKQKAGGQKKQGQKQQAGGQKKQDQKQQAGGQKKQNQKQQAGGQKKQDQKQQAGGQKKQNQKQKAGGQKKQGQYKSAFRKAMDALLKGNGRPGKPRSRKTAEKKPVKKTGLSEIDQAREQQLRSVPDDPTGLLRARIRQHYARLRARSQNQ